MKMDILIIHRYFIHSMVDKNAILYDDLKIDNSLISSKTWKLVVGINLPTNEKKLNTVYEKVVNIMSQVLVYYFV